MDKSSIVVKTCPFCGEKPSVIFSDHDDDFVTIACFNEKCMIRPVLGPMSPIKDAISEWNKRIDKKNGVR